MQLNIDLKEKLEPRALPALFDALSIDDLNKLVGWPSTAPILRAAAKQAHSHVILRSILTWEKALSEESIITCIDIETAVSVAELALKVGASRLCNLAMADALRIMDSNKRDIGRHATADFLRSVADLIHAKVVDTAVTRQIKQILVPVVLNVVRHDSVTHAPLPFFDHLAQLVRITNTEGVVELFISALLEQAHGAYIGFGEQLVTAAEVAHETNTKRIVRQFANIEHQRYATYLRTAGDTLTIGELRSLRWAAAHLKGTPFAEVVAGLPDA